MSKSSAVKIQIVTGDSRPIFKQIVDGIRMEIATGALSAGRRLPSYRGLAMQLMINPNTVAKAYSELNAEGLVESRQGLGLFVAERRQILSEDERDKRLHKAIDSFINETINLNFSEKEIAEQLKIKMKKLNKSKKGQERK